MRFPSLFFAIAFELTLVAAQPAQCANVTVDFGVDVYPIHADLFGNGNPGYTDLLSDWATPIQRLRAHMGNTVCRFYIQPSEVIPNSTVEDYLNNVDGIQDPNNWEGIKKLDQRFEQLHRAGYRLMVGIGASPGWLSWSGGSDGLPSDWAVYEDFTKKLISRYQDKIALLEVHNEPSGGGFSIAGSPYTSRAAAYKDLFLHTVTAVRQINSEIPLGGPVGSSALVPVDDGTRRTWLDWIIGDPDLKGKVDFLDFHLYPAPNYLTEYSSLTGFIRTKWKTDMDYIRSLFLRNGVTLPVYLTEWNDAAGDGDSFRNDPVYAPPFAASALAGMLNNGYSGANYYAIKDNGNFRMFNLLSDQKGEFLRPIEVIRLMSSTFGLQRGGGEVNASQVDSTALDVVAGRSNDPGEKFVLISNPNNASQPINLDFHNLGWSDETYLEYFLIDAEHQGREPHRWESKTPVAGAISLELVQPPYSVLGVRIDASTQDLTRWNSDQTELRNWALSNNSTRAEKRPIYYPTFAEQLGVLRTHPVSTRKPVNLDSSIKVPSDRPVLRIRAGSCPDGDWVLNVSVDGRRIYTTYVDTRSQFASYYVDLSKFAGRQVALRLQNALGGIKKARCEYAYWDSVDFVALNQDAVDRWNATQPVFSVYTPEIIGNADQTKLKSRYYRKLGEQFNVLRLRPKSADDAAAIVYREIQVPWYRHILEVDARAADAGSSWVLSALVDGNVVQSDTVEGNEWSKHRFDLSDHRGDFVALSLTNSPLSNAPVREGYIANINLVADNALYQPTVDAWNAHPEWFAWRLESLVPDGAPPLLLSEWNGGTSVLRIHPAEKGQPITLGTYTTVPRRTPYLKVSARAQPGYDFKLRLAVNFQTQLYTVIDGRRWTTQTLDLSEYSGQRIKLEFAGENGGPNSLWNSEYAFIDDVYFSDQP